jgi:hypothetical protein
VGLDTRGLEQRQFAALPIGQFAANFQFIVSGFFSGCCQLRQEKKLGFAAFVFNKFSGSLTMSLGT